MVEWINSLVIRASGKASIWDADTLPAIGRDGKPRQSERRWWLAAILASVGVAFGIHRLRAYAEQLGSARGAEQRVYRNDNGE